LHIVTIISFSEIFRKGRFLLFILYVSNHAGRRLATAEKNVFKSHPSATEIVHIRGEMVVKWWWTRASRSLLWIYKLQSWS